MQIQNYPFDFRTSQNKVFPETEQEYFMRVACEYEAARVIRKREETKQKVRAAIVAALNLLNFKRTRNLESLLGQ